MNDVDRNLDANPSSATRGWLWVNPERLERFAADVEQLITRLEALRVRQADAAWFRSPSTDPATLAVTARLAEDGYDFDGTPVHAVARVIDDLRQQVVAARLAARDYDAGEQSAIEYMDKTGEGP